MRLARSKRRGRGRGGEVTAKQDTRGGKATIKDRPERDRQTNGQSTGERGQTVRAGGIYTGRQRWLLRV